MKKYLIILFRIPGLDIRPAFFACLLAFVFSSTYGQESSMDSLLANASKLKDKILYQNHDSSYIKSFADKITVKLLADNRFNAFSIYDQSLNSRIRYRPDLGVTFGIGAAYKWLALDINTGWGFKESNISSSIYRDIQARILTSKHYIRLRYQYYYGYKLGHITGYDEDQLAEFETRSDLRTMQFGIQYLYTFNYGKFSIKAPFVMNEMQKKSAGSFVAGFNFFMYAMNADSSLIPAELESPSAAWNDFSEMNLVSLTASFGYMHSFILKNHIFFTVSLIPGVGLKNGDYWVHGDRVPINNLLVLRAKSMNSLGYNGDRFFVGIQLITGIDYLPLEKNLKSAILEGRSALFFGYRFR